MSLHMENTWRGGRPERSSRVSNYYWNSSLCHPSWGSELVLPSAGSSCRAGAKPSVQHILST